VRARLDAVLVAARVAPAARHIGLVPTMVSTHTEPFHASKAIATLDHVSQGRAGVRVKASADRAEWEHVGRRELPPFDPARYDSPQVQALATELFEEAADWVEVLRRLWDSWEDDAEIRDAATGRFVDRDRLHYVDFTGPRFSVKGPSITPRPPQGQPLVTALGHASVPYRFIAGSADVGYLTPRDGDDAAALVSQVRALRAAGHRAQEPLHLFGDLVVFLDRTEAAAQDRKERLDALSGVPFTSDALVFTGTAVGLADLLLDWQSRGLTGSRLRPGTVPHDLEAITRTLVPELQRRGAFRTAYEATTLRGLLGLVRPSNRYAEVAP
jgi:alkanesulfonate monooxygenase SsuD/methylene tetrahydromethanopterin reductase-like flavin-dependent oxidoreductase (luciferase family)